MMGGLQIYGIVALEALWGTSLSLATTAITVYLAMMAFAVLIGGFISAKTERHDLVAVIGLALSALTLVPVAFFDLGAAALIGFLGLSGFFNGVLQPSRDMIVRAITPPGAFGRVFGFVTTGFNIGGVIAPLDLRIHDGSRRTASRHSRRRILRADFNSDGDDHGCATREKLLIRALRHCGECSARRLVDEM